MKTDRYETRKTRRRVHIGEVDKIFFAVSKATGISVEAMKSKERKQVLADARHMFCYVAWKFTDLPLQVIGGQINRNHTSVINSRNKAIGLKDSDRDFGGKLKEAINTYMSS